MAKAQKPKRRPPHMRNVRIVAALLRRAEKDHAAMLAENRLRRGSAAAEPASDKPLHTAQQLRRSRERIAGRRADLAAALDARG